MATAVGSFIWFVVRKRRERIWIPTLRLIKMDVSPLPKLRLVKPPLIFFFCFLGCAMTMIWLTLKPKEIRYKEINNYENRTHVFIDLSPSLSIADRQQRNKLISSIYPQFSQSGFLTFSTSINLEPVSFRSEDDFLSYLNELKVQRVGTKLGDVLQKQLEIVGKIDRLVLISDEDKHSWSGFNWKVLEDKIEVLHGIVPSSDDKRNTYIQSVEPLKQVQKQETGWAVKISRNYDGETVGGSLSLAVGEKNIRARRWQIPVDLKSVEIPIRIPFDVLRENGAVFDSDILDWSISVDGPDAMKLDNSYKSYFKGFKKQVLLVSAVSGEMFLDDNVYHLSSALDILGFETQRIDKIYAPVGRFSAFFQIFTYQLIGAALIELVTTGSYYLYAPDKILGTSRSFFYDGNIWPNTVYFHGIEITTTLITSLIFSISIVFMTSYYHLVKSIKSKPNIEVQA